MADFGKRKATIVAESHIDRVDVSTISGGYRVVTPGVGVRVEFSHGDHERALDMLNSLVDNVRAQIADTVESRSRGD